MIWNRISSRGALETCCSLLALAAPLVGAACHGETGLPSNTASDETVTRLALTGSGLPTPAGWWSFDEKCSTSVVYDTLTLPATANGSELNGVGCVEGQIGRAVSFDGVDDMVQIPDRANLHFTNAMTMSAWVKRTSATGFIAGKWASPNSYQLTLNAGKPVFSLTFAGGASGTLVSVTGPTALSTTAYSHVAGVYDGATMRLYVNGTQVASVARTGTLLSSSAPIRVGKVPSGSAFQGSVDELRLYGVALSATQVGRLASGLPHRRIRAVAFDPLRANSTLRMHTMFANWRAPEVVLQWWTEALNFGAGETLYLPEDGDYASAVKYVEEIPWNNTSYVGGCEYVRGNSLVVNTAEQYFDMVTNNLPRPQSDQDIFRAFKAFNPALNFDLIADANGQYFHEMIAVSLPGPGWKEGTMVANTNDGTAYASHDGVLRDPGLQMNKKFIFHGVGFEKDERNLEQFMHREELTLSLAFSTVASGDPTVDHCGTGQTWGLSAIDPHNDNTPFDLFTTNDTQNDGDNYVVLGEAHVGWAHQPPNAVVQYVRDHDDRVPSNYQFWATFPQNYPFDLTKRNRRVMVSCETWDGVGQCGRSDRDTFAMTWQLQQLPKNDGFFDGRANNWWKYVSNPNYQVGRGQAVTKPVKGPFHGAMDLSLTLQQHNIVLRWKTEVAQLGSYQVQWSTDRVTWTPLVTLPGSASNWQGGLSQPGIDTFYRVRWTSGTTNLFSDQLGVNIGGATPVNVSGDQRPPINLTIALYQQGVPYVRWELPNSCGLGNSDPNAPCTTSDLTCQAGVCRNPGGVRMSDYHGGLAHYQLLKRETGYSIIGSVGRKPNADQFNHMNFSSADPAAAGGAVSGYRVIAYHDDGTGSGLGSTYGQTDVVLAVPNQATVGN